MLYDPPMLLIAHVSGRTWRTMMALLHAAKENLPKWLGVIVGIALLIPGPQDEALVAVIVIGYMCLPKRGRALRIASLDAIRMW